MVRWPSEAVDLQPVPTASQRHRTKPQVSTVCGICAPLGHPGGELRSERCPVLDQGVLLRSVDRIKGYYTGEGVGASRLVHWADFERPGIR